MEIENKEYIRLKLATCFREILKKKRKIDQKNKKNEIEDLRLVSSMRQLEAESGLSYTIIHGVSVGKRDLQFSSLMTIIESLGLSFSEFAKAFDKITDQQIQNTISEIESRKKSTTRLVKKKK